MITLAKQITLVGLNTFEITPIHSFKTPKLNEKTLTHNTWFQFFVADGIQMLEFSSIYLENTVAALNIAMPSIHHFDKNLEMLLDQCYHVVLVLVA